MPNPNLSILLAALQGAAICLLPFDIEAQLLPSEVGATVSGFQDDFDGGSLNPNWAVRGVSVFSVGGGMLHVATAAGDPNHLLYELGGYNSSVQEGLARIRVTNFGSGDPARAGLSAVADAGTSQGINLMFRDEPSPFLCAITRPLSSLPAPSWQRASSQEPSSPPPASRRPLPASPWEEPSCRSR